MRPDDGIVNCVMPLISTLSRVPCCAVAVMFHCRPRQPILPTRESLAISRISSNGCDPQMTVSLQSPEQMEQKNNVNKAAFVSFACLFLSQI